MGIGIVELFLGLLVLVLLIVTVAGVVVAVIWYSTRGERVSGMGGPPAPPPGALRTDEDAIETLRKRYARGEISREEYLQIRQDLMD